MNYPEINTITDTRNAEANKPAATIPTIFPVSKETETVNSSVLESRFFWGSSCFSELAFLSAWAFFSAKAFFSAAAFFSAKAFFSAWAVPLAL